ncbi:zinc ABC transporter permease AztB [Nocardia mangyaensis]|uniref:zinc ABC transporter permease AztB n=1 Tax=Nocardia mangyaensis TaxID=2213200 RepID=UPI0026750C59|nr:zinc ABC transporter permease AztB [Nocardia mangyaensis]MDO3648637.1 zinc ABC transporter permease AztB [Nocardia mangyaensis]
MDWLIAPFEVAFVQRALWGGLLVSCVCALAGTWVVVRGMAFLGDAMAHGMLPGVAVAALLGGNLLVGAAVSCAAMAFGVSVLGRSKRFATDTAIGLLFVGMLAAGVIIVSRSQSFAVDLTGFLFGDVLAVRSRDLWYLVAALAVAVVVAVLGHRAFLALSFDPRKAHTLGLRPKLAHAALIGLVTLAIVASFHVVGTLLVFGLLIAPPAAAMYWSDRIPVIMAVAALIGGLSTVGGLVISWHAGTAAGATIAAVAVGAFFLSAIVSALRERVGRVGAASVAALAAVPLVGCGTAEEPAVVEETPHGFVAGAEEMSEAQTRLVVVEAGTGAVRVVDLLTEEVTPVELSLEDAAVQPNPTGSPTDGAPALRLADDGRFAYLSSGDRIHIIDSGAWTVDHGDHRHYYSAPIRSVGAAMVPGDASTSNESGVVAAYGDSALAAVVLESGATVVFDRVALGEGVVPEPRRIDGIAVPYGERLIVADGTGRVDVRDRDGAPGQVQSETCPVPQGQAVTRRGVVFGCADGALVVGQREGEFVTEKIPYPTPTADRATAFTHRPGSTTLTALAGRDAVWSVDIRTKNWTHTPLADAVAANTAGEGSALLALTRDGVLHGIDPVSGTRTAQVDLLTGPVEGRPVIQVDPNRAYLNDSRARTVHEIAYNDNLRTAREFPLDIEPSLLVETGL